MDADREILRHDRFPQEAGALHSEWQQIQLQTAKGHPQAGAEALALNPPTVSKNDHGMPTQIVYPDGETKSIEYFDDGTSIKSASQNGTTFWRKSADAEDWYTTSSDKTTGPLRDKVSFTKDFDYVVLSLDDKYHFTTIKRLDGTQQVAANDGKRSIEYDIDNNPTKVVDGDKTWNLTDNKTNSWTSTTGETQHLAIDYAKYAYKDNKGLIHEFPLDGGEKTVKASNPSAIIKLENSVSQQFKDRLYDTLAEYPQSVLNLLANSGIKVIGAKALTDAFPDLKGQHPRGWPEGWTWDRSDGIYRPDMSKLGAAETVFDGTRTAETSRLEGVIRHESGHAVDAALGDFSSSRVFVDAYNKDVAEMSERDKGNNTYTLQAGEAGHQETFAEVFASINGASTNMPQDERIRRSYPHVRQVIEDRLKQLEHSPITTAHHHLRQRSFEPHAEKQTQDNCLVQELIPIPIPKE